MIEYFQENDGTVRPNQTTDLQLYSFWSQESITAEERAEGVVTKLTMDCSGVRLDNDKKVFRFNGIKFILSPDNPRRNEFDYYKVKIVMPEEDIKHIDACQVSKVEKEAFICYKYYFVKDPEFLEKLPEPPDEFYDTLPF